MVMIRQGGPVRRLTKLEVSGDPDAAIAANIGADVRIGTLQGVAVDFRHPLLPSDWWARPWWYVAGDSEHHCGVVFPGEADYVQAHPEIELPKGLVVACRGDSLTVGRVEEKSEPSRLHHRHDTGVRLAFLVLTRVDGTRIDEIGPLAFYGSTRLIGHGSREAFDNMVARIADGGDLGLDDFPPSWGEDRSAAHDIARYNAKVAHDALFEMIDRLGDDTKRLVELRRLVNAAALMGFALAKHEAQGAAKWDAGAAKGAKAGGEKTADHVARDMARELWADNPTATVYWVAKQICAAHKDKQQGTVERSIKRLTPETSPSYDPGRGYGE